VDASPLAVLRARVLAVDSDGMLRALYLRSFTTAGFDTAQAADGREALTKALMRPPHLIVMELRLPLIDGVSLCELLRRDRATARTAILVVTAERRPVELERIRRAGADDVLLKPVSLDVLVQRAGELVTALIDAGPHHKTAVASAQPGLTMTPPLVPPALTCPSCDRTLTYQVSQTGSVTERHSEQWDYFSCCACGGFQYRHRTRKLRRLDASKEQWLRWQQAASER